MAELYKIVLSPSFEKTLRKLMTTSEYDPLKKKIKQICENPAHYKPLRNVMAGKRRTHLGSMVLIFTVEDTTRTITFLDYCHHDDAYE